MCVAAIPQDSNLCSMLRLQPRQARARAQELGCSEAPIPEHDWASTIPMGRVLKLFPRMLQSHLATTSRLRVALTLLLTRIATPPSQSDAIDWHSKKQVAVKTAPHGSELITAPRTAADQVVGLHAALQPRCSCLLETRVAHHSEETRL